MRGEVIFGVSPSLSPRFEGEPEIRGGNPHANPATVRVPELSFLPGTAQAKGITGYQKATHLLVLRNEYCWALTLLELRLNQHINTRATGLWTLPFLICQVDLEGHQRKYTRVITQKPFLRN